MSEQPFNQPLEDEISLKEIIDFLLESWKVMALSGIVGGFLAAGNAFVTPSKYQATAAIQVAKVAGNDVETPSILVEKLKIPTYFSIASHSDCNVMNTFEPGLVIVKNLMPTLSKTSPIISFSYKDESSEKAQKCLESVVNDIRNNQNLLAKPTIDAKKKQLLDLRGKLDSSERVLKLLTNKNSNFDISDSKFSASTLLLSLTFNKENEIEGLRSQINYLEIELMEPQTKETSLTAPIYAPKKKVSNNIVLSLLGGLMVGLFLGLLLMIGKRAFTAIKLRMNNQLMGQTE